MTKKIILVSTNRSFTLENTTLPSSLAYLLYNNELYP